MAKPMPIVVEHFAGEILRRVSKSFVNSELSKQAFDDIVGHLEAIKLITSVPANVTKGEDDYEESNTTST